MKPRRPGNEEPQGELFRTELAYLINPDHPLAKLALVVNWTRLDEVFLPLYVEEVGRPGIPTRLMVGLHYLKHIHQLSDEDVVEQWVENPYWQHLCGSRYFGHKVGIVTTAREQFVVGALALHHRPFDGHTLAACMD